MGTPNFAASNPLANQFTLSVLDKMTNGAEMRRVAVERQALVMSLKATGRSQPATILNFNPVPLVLDGGIGFKVPSVIDEAVPDDQRFEYKFEGRIYKASVLTIHEPKTYLKPKDVKEQDGIPGAVYDVMACLPIEIAHCFHVAYTQGVLGSATGTGGVVIFEGDRRSLERAGGKRLNIKVPKYIPLPNRTREYVTEPKDFDETVVACLKLQRLFANRATQEAQTYWDQEDQRGNITPVHRIWHQYEMDKAYRQVAAPWVTLTNENAETCVGCGETRKRVEAYFCHKCNRVYDPFEAYRDGEIPIEHPALNRCTAEQWESIRAIEAKRVAMRTGVTDKKEK